MLAGQRADVFTHALQSLPHLPPAGHELFDRRTVRVIIINRANVGLRFARLGLPGGDFAFDRFGEGRRRAKVRIPFLRAADRSSCLCLG